MVHTVYSPDLADKMTLLVALKGKDGIVAAADSRGTFGDPRGVTAQNDSQQKVHLVSDHVAVLMAGSGELGSQLISEIAKKARDAHTDGVTSVLELVRTVARQRYDEWFAHLPPALPPGMMGVARPDLAFMVAGYDPDAAGKFTQPRLYQALSPLHFPPMLHEYGFALSGVAQYALYLLNRLYEPDRSLADLSALAVYVITETASQDGKVGGPIRLVTITPEAGGTQLNDEAVQKLQGSNVARAEALRNSFYTKK
jgi:20S proteasome alpha/beta subunit